MNHLMHLTARTLAAAGLDLPKGAVAALAVDAAATEAANVPPTADLLELLNAGKVTPANVGKHVAEAATRMAAQQFAQQVVRDLDGPLRMSFNAAVRAEAPALLLAMRPRFDAAAAVVEAAAEHFPPGATDKQILAGGAASAAAHEQLSEACAELGRVRAVRVLLADLTGEGEQEVSWFIASAADATDLERASWAWRQPADPFHSVAAAGFRLRLNTPQEAAVITSAAARATALAEQAERERLVSEAREGWPAYGAA